MKPQMPIFSLKLIFTAILCLAITPLASAQADEPAAKAPEGGPAAVMDLTAVSQHYRDVVARPEFQDSGESALDTRFEDWLSQWFKRLGDKIGNFKYASQMPAFESFFMALLVVFSISVLFYVLLRLTRRRKGMEAEPADQSPGPQAFRPPEFYDAEIRVALATRDWKTAWLAAWRQFLSRLEHRNLVDADRTRTNREYLAQLLEKPLPPAAVSLLNAMVDAYDRFVYGRTSIGEAEWDSFHRHIDEAALLLHLDDKRGALKANRGPS